MRCEGGTITVWRGAPDGSGMTQVLHTTAAPVTTMQRIDFTCDSYADFSIDDIRVLAGDGSVASSKKSTRNGIRCLT